MLKKVIFRFETRDDFVISSLSDFLLGFDVISVETYEDFNDVVFLASEEQDYLAIVGKAKEFLSFLNVSDFDVIIEDFEEKDWVEEFKKFFKPFDMNKYFRVIPLWEKGNKSVYSEGKINLIIEPGQAFGTGLHGTTSLCAEFLKEYAENKNGFTMLDVGTGSGILSVIGKKLGAKEITAFDIDPHCSEVFVKNFEINDINLDNINFFIGEIRDLRVKCYDIVIVNIIESIVRDILKDVIPFVGDKLVISGILEKDSDGFEKFLKKFNLKILDRRVNGEWIGYLIER
ncbi:ribosomal protein L11 methyltransferase [Thermotomaculum hydrothermale]|uniref:Ribosomal protein L11 methyltransferase n=1 Tax=Thermotomaculum hydrothermale TaxID=981385 RepID=A0A7R6PE49_9BACT|nr:50S ribosomal protein L11 methyltransferase [Thermotomaculum hydrothermale]BBB32074.1 ribosomal protein L11 methyltransferase [Thermotomaculum hydrothermale]